MHFHRPDDVFIDNEDQLTFTLHPVPTSADVVRARLRALERSTSINTLLREYLEAFARAESDRLLVDHEGYREGVRTVADATGRRDEGGGWRWRR